MLAPLMRVWRLSIYIYIDRVEMFLICNNIDDSRKVPTLLSLIGSHLFKLATDLLLPKRLRDCSFDEIVNTLKLHYRPKVNIIRERYNFFSRSQKLNESTQDFIAALKFLSKSCDFGSNYEDSLRDKFVVGLYNDSIRAHLLTIPNLSYAQAVDISIAKEIASADARAMSSSKVTNREVMQVNSNSLQFTQMQKYKMNAHSSPNKFNMKNSGLTCFGCGGNHFRKDCSYKEAKCHKCDKFGHISPVCKSEKVNNSTKAHTNANNSKYSRDKKQHKSGSPSHYVHNPRNSVRDEYVFHTGSHDPFFISLKINGHKTSFEVDSGSARTLMSVNVFNSLFRHVKPKINPSETSLRTYGEGEMHVLGEVSVDVEHQGVSDSLILLIVKEEGPSLLGRGWINSHSAPYLQALGRILSTSEVNSVATTSISNKEIEAFLDQFSELFKSDFGILKDVKVNFPVDSSVSPRFCKARPVPFSLKSKLDDELDFLLKHGVISPVRHSPWAAPVVPVLKKNGKIRICGDYKITANKAIIPDSYPLPKPKELMSRLSKGKYFAKIDLANAFNQLELEEDSKKFTTINTHRGLFQYNKMCFGISSAPSIFQKQMEILLATHKNVLIFSDDIWYLDPHL